MKFTWRLKLTVASDIPVVYKPLWESWWVVSMANTLRVGMVVLLQILRLEWGTYLWYFICLSAFTRLGSYHAGWFLTWGNSWCWRGVMRGKWRQLYLNNNKKKGKKSVNWYPLEKLLKNEKLEMGNWKSSDFFCLLLTLHFVFLTFYYCEWIVPTIPVLHTVHHSLGYITYINLEHYWMKIHPKGKHT